MRYIIVVLIFSLFGCANLYTQDKKNSPEIITLSGKQYYEHIVEKGNTLYYLHKEYGVPIDVLKTNNPNLSNGLSIGEKVLIPVKTKMQEASNDPNFIVHKVRIGQSIYAIAREYNVKPIAITNANPGVIENLDVGQMIKIPVADLQSSDGAVEKMNISQKQVRLHHVRKGETLYFLSKLYGVSVDAIVLENGGLKEGLKVGESVKIPGSAQYVQGVDSGDPFYDATSLAINSMDSTLTIDSILAFPAIKKPVYRVALLMPLYLDKNMLIISDPNTFRKQIFPKSRFGLDFYRGLLLALDSISENTSEKFELLVCDTKGKDPENVKRIIQDYRVQKSDVIIGPLYGSNFQIVSGFAKKHQIPIISPVKQNSKILLGNPYVLKAIPSKTSTIGGVAKYVAGTFKNEQVMLVKHRTSKEHKLVDIFMEEYKDELSASLDSIVFPLPKVVEIDKEISAILPKLSPNKNNVLYVPSTNHSFVTSMVIYFQKILKTSMYNDYQITLIGMKEWMKYENLDYGYYHDLNVHFSVDDYIDEEASACYLNKFTSKHHIIPSNSAYLGHDLGMYVANQLIRYGKLLNPSIVGDEYRGLAYAFKFQRTGLESGFENQSGYLLKAIDTGFEQVLK